MSQDLVFLVVRRKGSVIMMLFSKTFLRSKSSFLSSFKKLFLLTLVISSSALAAPTADEYVNLYKQFWLPSSAKAALKAEYARVLASDEFNGDLGRFYNATQNSLTERKDGRSFYSRNVKFYFSLGHTAECI